MSRSRELARYRTAILSKSFIQKLPKDFRGIYTCRVSSALSYTSCPRSLPVPGQLCLCFVFLPPLTLLHSARPFIPPMVRLLLALALLLVGRLADAATVKYTFTVLLSLSPFLSNMHSSFIRSVQSVEFRKLKLLARRRTCFSSFVLLP